MFSVVLDTYRDRQSAYLFTVNPLGTQADVRIANDGRTQDGSCDATWSAEAAVAPRGNASYLGITGSVMRLG